MVGSAPPSDNMKKKKKILSGPLLLGSDGVSDDDDDEEEVTMDETQTINLIGEIVGGHKLTLYDDDNNNHGDDIIGGGSGDDDEMKPYCIVKLGDKILHTTQPTESGGGSNNPVWTVLTDAFFLVRATPADLVHNKLEVSVWTKRCGGPLKISVLESNLCLGRACVDLSKVPLNEERIDLTLRQQGEDAMMMECSELKRGTLTVRFRLSTPADEKFLKLLKHRPELLRQRTMRTGDNDIDTATEQKMLKDSLLVTETNETNKAGETFLYAVTSAFTSKKYFDKTIGQHKVLVKPHPDPHNANATTYLTQREIDYVTTQPSHQWVEAGSGTLGKVYLEILSCHNLPNVDVGEAVGNVTDAFVAAVYEDAMVQTPVIDDELSPHWLPWTQRAFIFKMLHPASTLYLATFDYDLGVLSNHQPLGRVAVNISNFQRDTDYTLTYNLYPSSNVTDRTAAGSITIRLRVEYSNEKEALMAALRQPRPTFHINVRREKSHAVLRYTCFGEYGDDNEHPFDLTVTSSYINEIFEYKRDIGYCFGDAIRSLVFWRGQVRVMNLYIPLHSFILFWGATTLVERPYLLPSFLLLSVAWMMLATQTQRRQHPSPWYTCHSFGYYLNILRTGQSSLSVRQITTNQGLAEIKAHHEAWQNRLANDERVAAKQAEMQQEIANLGDDAIHTKSPMGIPIAMFQRLTRYQGIIGRMCKKMRLVKSIVTWEEGAVSFWITFCFLVAGLVSLLLPWAFILLWTGRLVVWGLLGPHMMLVDCWLRAASNGNNSDDVLEKAIANFHKESWFARIRRQEALKLRDMKCLAFGKYITLVPSHNLSRHFDRPLSSSSARWHNPAVHASPIKIAPRGIPGQQLMGVILPRTESEVMQYANDFKALAKRQMAFLRCVSAIRETENSAKMKRLVTKAAAALDDEDAFNVRVGYEVISCTNGNAMCTTIGDTSDGREYEGTGVEVPSHGSSVSIVHMETRGGSNQSPCTDSTQEEPTKDLDDKHTSPSTKASVRSNVKSYPSSDSRKSRGDRRDSKRGSVKHKHKSSRGSRRSNRSTPRLPSLHETEIEDECRECGEVEILWASPVAREEPSADNDDAIHPIVEANVDWNGQKIKLELMDDATVDLGCLFRSKNNTMGIVDDDDDDDVDHKSTTSCIVFVQPQKHTEEIPSSSMDAFDTKDVVIPQNVSFEDAPFSSDVSCITAVSKA